LIRRHALPRWGNLRASSVGRADVRAMMSRIDAPVLANQVLAAVSAIFSWAVKQEVVGTNPCRGVDRNATRSRERVLSDSEIPRFWSAFDDAGLIISTALKTILLTGQRPGELGRTSGTCDPPVGGTVGFWKLPMPPLAKTCPKTVSAPERGGLSVEGDFAKNFSGTLTESPMLACGTFRLALAKCGSSLTERTSRQARPSSTISGILGGADLRRWMAFHPHGNDTKVLPIGSAGPSRDWGSLRPDIHRWCLRRRLRVAATMGFAVNQRS
jgi:hypothetical protein